MSNEIAKPDPVNPPADAATDADKPARRDIDLPRPGKDPAGLRRAATEVYLTTVTASIFASQTGEFVTDNTGVAAEAFIAALRESVGPRDLVEEMLVSQLVFLHARIARLICLADKQTQTKNVAVVNHALDAALNAFRKHVAALAERQNPRQPASFVAIKEIQQNIANNQQVNNNFENENAKKVIPSNEKGPLAALPPITGGLGVAQGNDRADEAVAIDDRSEDGGGQGAEQPQCATARVQDGRADLDTTGNRGAAPIHTRRRPSRR